MYYANDWKGTNIPHVSGWLTGALHLFYSLILSYFIFNIFPHPVKVLRQGKQFSRQTPIVCLCLKAYSITCYNLITFPQRLPGTELLFCPGVQRFLYFDRVSFLYLFTGGVLLQLHPQELPCNYKTSVWIEPHPDSVVNLSRQIRPNTKIQFQGKVFIFLKFYVKNIFCVI